MDGTFIGPVTVADFLDQYVPSAPDPRPAGPIVFEPPDDAKKYEATFTAAINGSGFCPALELYVTKERADPSAPLHKRKPDISAFQKSTDTDPQVDHVVWRTIELYFEVKPPNCDPFTDPKVDISDEERLKHGFQHQSDDATKARGQIASYVHASVFSVCLMGTTAYSKGVPNIPEFGCAGDVLVDERPQRTRCQDYSGPSGKTRALTAHVHYRLALYTIGRKLKTFKSTNELCRALRDGLTAHSKAFTLARVMHRDVSAGNVMIGPTGKGLLIDWDLSKILEDLVHETARQEWRTGTWQFISARRLADIHKRHEYSDDLESFVHVLTFHLLRYRCTKFRGLETGFYNLFEFVEEDDDGENYGGDGKRNFFVGTLFESPCWHNVFPAPCADLVEDLRELFQPLYEVARRKDPAKLAATLEKLASANAMIKVFNEQLKSEGWPTDDGSEEVMFKRPAHEKFSPRHLKHARESEEPATSKRLRVDLKKAGSSARRSRASQQQKSGVKRSNARQ